MIDEKKKKQNERRNFFLCIAKETNTQNRDKLKPNRPVVHSIFQLLNLYFPIKKKGIYNRGKTKNCIKIHKNNKKRKCDKIKQQLKRRSKYSLLFDFHFLSLLFFIFLLLCIFTSPARFLAKTERTEFLFYHNHSF